MGKGPFKSFGEAQIAFHVNLKGDYVGGTVDYGRPTSPGREVITKFWLIF